MNTRKKGLLSALASGVASVLGLGAPSVFAQQQADQREASVIEEVTVTGSRIVRRDLIANSPITTVGQARLEESSTIALESVLNQLPQFVPSTTQFQTAPSGQTTADGEPGMTPSAATLSLRGLGRNRNLVLVDGRRAMPIDASMAVDINTIPSAAIARVETITGGASSVYGADAVAGVVNFILKRDFEGFDLDAQYSMTEQGDAEERKVSALFGANFSGGGNVMIGIERYERGQILMQDRDFYTKGWADTGSLGGQQVFYVAPYANSPADNPFSQEAVNAVFSDAPGSVVRTGNFYLNNDGSLYRTNADGTYRYNGPTVSADGKVYRFIRDDTGGLAENWIDQQISSPLSRTSMFARGHTDITDTITAFAQLVFAESTSQHRERIAGMTGGWGGSVPHGDEIYAPSVDENGNTLPAYLPGARLGLNCPPVGGCTKSQAWPKSPELQFLADSREDREAPLIMGSAATWLGDNSGSNVTSTVYQVAAGLEGRLPARDWTWDLYVSRGTSTTENELWGTMSIARWRHLINQPNYGKGHFEQGNAEGNNFGAGSLECTSGFTFLGQGESTYLGGLGIPSSYEVSQDCIDATALRFSLNGRTEQTVAEFNLQGGIVDMPAGRLQFALGTAYRENEFTWYPPPIVTRESIFDTVAGITARSATDGRITATDVYGELLVPLLADKPFAQRMELELGYRYSDNNPTDSVDTYKALLDWQVTPRVRVRGGRQIANRAPNVAELYQNGVLVLFTGNQGDWCSDLNPISPLAPTSDNPNAAQVRAICETLMGDIGAEFYYTNPDRNAAALHYSFSLLEGNQNLDFETAKTTTIGVVANLTDRITLTADYWRIAISDMITPEIPVGVYTKCLSPESNPTFDPAHPSCGQIIRNPFNGTEGNMSLLFTNAGAADFSGYDVSLNWDREVGPGLLSVDTVLTISDKAKSRPAPDLPWRDWTGTSGPSDLFGVSGWTYDYRSVVSTNYMVGSWSATLRWRHLPSIASEVTAVVPTHTFSPTSSYNVFDFAGRYSRGGIWNLRFGIDNLFDKEPERTFPQATPVNNATGSTNASFYDILGRRYYVGMSMQF